MKIEEVFDKIWITRLDEVFDTKIPVNGWKTGEDNQLIGTIKIDSETYEIYIEPGTYIINDKTYSFLNVAFAKIINGKPTSELQFTSKNISKIVGAIRNALLLEIKKYQTDAIVFIANDNVEKRMKLYNKLVISKLSGITLDRYKTNIDLGDGRKMSVILGEDLSEDDQEQFFDFLKSKGK